MKNMEIFCPTLNKPPLNNDKLKTNCNWNQLKFIAKHLVPRFKPNKKLCLAAYNIWGMFKPAPFRKVS